MPPTDFPLEEVFVSKGPPKRVIVYIHGTFSPDAQWTKIDSTFTQTLLQCVDGLRIYRFVWTGRNSMEQRYVAGEHLCAHLKTLHAEVPNVQFHLIAHSHGGNVALYALRERECADTIAGVVCMSTPFLHLQPSRIDRESQLTETLITLPVFVALTGCVLWTHSTKAPCLSGVYCPTFPMAVKRPRSAMAISRFEVDQPLPTPTG